MLLEKPKPITSQPTDIILKEEILPRTLFTLSPNDFAKHLYIYSTIFSLGEEIAKKKIPADTKLLSEITLRTLKENGYTPFQYDNERVIELMREQGKKVPNSEPDE